MIHCRRDTLQLYFRLIPPDVSMAITMEVFLEQYERCRKVRFHHVLVGLLGTHNCFQAMAFLRFLSATII